MNAPSKPGWYWYNDGGEWEVVLVRGNKFLYVKRLSGYTQSGVPLSCVRGTWGSEVKRGE